VPQDQPTIQAGIDAAAIGDTVLVSPGTYTGIGNRDVRFKGKLIVVACEAAPNCVVDPQGAGRGFLFDSGETNAAVLRGFTIRNGIAPGRLPANSGGGIFANGGSPTIEQNVITNNAAGWGGGGIQVQDASPVIQNNTISQNTSYYAGGVGVVGGNAIVRGNTITNNHATDADGGGIYSRNSPSPQFIGNYIANNDAIWNGGGIFLISSSPVISNNIIASNTAGDDGGGIYAQNFASPTMANNTIAGNVATRGGAIGARLGSRPTGVNLILWGNAPNQVFTELGSAVTLTFSDVMGGHPGAGNINADPLFVSPASGDFHITAPSPCVGAGTSGPSVPTVDFDGDPRPSPTGSNPDIGADEIGSPA
jgi:parallel beta-helix repeat protein